MQHSIESTTSNFVALEVDFDRTARLVLITSFRLLSSLCVFAVTFSLATASAIWSAVMCESLSLGLIDKFPFETNLGEFDYRSSIRSKHLEWDLLTVIHRFNLIFPETVREGLYDCEREEVLRNDYIRLIVSFSYSLLHSLD